MFKLNKLALVLATAFSATSAFAAPVTQTDIQNATTLNQAWISGASAPTVNIFRGFAAGCAADSLAIFHGGDLTTPVLPGTSSGTLTTGNTFAYACVRGGVVSVLYHTNQGGSFNAYAPHIPNDVDGDGITGTTTELNRLADIRTNSCSNRGTNNLSTAQPAVPIYQCATTINGFTATDGTPNKPAGGFSDVEAALWGVTVTGYGTEGNAGVTQGFGVMASENLYRAMQVAQGIYTDLATANTNDPSFLPQNAPNLTKQQYASIASNYESNGGVLGADSTKKLIVARRINTSGTQAASNAFFLGSPCLGNPNTGGVLTPTTAADSGDLYEVFEGGETSEVRTKISGVTADEYAIGVVSLENAPAAGRRYLKLDGVHPQAGNFTNTTTDSLQRWTTAQGIYPMQFQLKTFVANDASTFGRQVIADIVAGVSAVSCTQVPRGLALSAATTACPVANTGTHIAKTWRTAGNNCSPLVWK